MGFTVDPWSDRFPDLFREAHVDYADCRIRYTTAPVEEELVSRLHLVAVTEAGHVVVCRSDQGWRFLPGGTREPGESLTALASRELMEEAGAVLVGEIQCFSAHVADSSRAQPYRPHLPHPRAYWAYAVAQVQLVGAPTNPPGGETVIEVVAMPPATGAEYLQEGEDPIHADVLRHADALGLVRAWAEG
jgi:8-oxo-dGTP diphosphatase